MIQAMQVLQLPLLELSERIEQELVENPFLEVVEPERDDGADAGADREPATDGADAMLDYLERIDRDFGDGGPPRAAGGEEGDRKYEAMLNAPEGARTFAADILDQLSALQDRHAVIGQVRSKGLFLGAELVADRDTREAAAEAQVQAVVADCMGQGVIIGATNRSVPGKNNTLCFSPALIATKSDIDEIVTAVDGALTRVFG